MKTWIKNVKIIVQDNDLEVVDILLDENEIIEIGTAISCKDCNVIEGNQLVALPGLIDVHVHLREPGYCEKETIKTGALAAAKGGFTTIFAMPNVIPFPDNLEQIKVYEKMLQQGCVNIFPYACITKEEKGKEVVAMENLKRHGIFAYSDDGVGIMEDAIMKEAMLKSVACDTMIVAHTEDLNYRKPKACMHEGIQNKKLGYIGIPSACESEQLLRDLKLVEETKAKYHVCHLSAKESVAYLKEYKAKGCDVSGEVTVHHLLLNEEDVKDDANYKMNPPLRSKEDQNALLKGLLDGTIDMIANDHAPHTRVEKERGMELAPFGIVALETAFPLLYTNLVLQNKVTFQQLVYWMSEAPAKRFRLHKKGILKKGYASDLILIDIESEKCIDISTFVSKGKNTPFNGWKCKGFVKYCFVNGKIVYQEEKENKDGSM